MWRVILLVVLLTFTTGARCLFAQDDDELDLFNTEYKQIILSAAKSKTKSITFYADKRYSRGTKKLKITFLNDSVFERKSGLHKSTYVIRRGVFVLCDPKAKQSAETPTLHATDSAGCKVYWGSTTEEGKAVSYSRYMYDSLGREIDYYFTYWTTCYHTVTRYEGDTVTIRQRWARSLQGDSMYLYLTSYSYESYNEDSTFFIRTIRYSPKWANSINANKPYDSDTRKYITYDAQHRIVAVKREETGYYTDGDSTVGVSNLRVVYH